MCAASSGSGIRPVRTRASAHAEALELGLEALRVGDRPHEQQAQSRVRRRRARHGARHGERPFLRRQQAEDADHEVARREAEAGAQLAHRARVHGHAAHRHRRARHLRLGQLFPDRLGHEAVVHRHEPRGLDGDPEQRVGVGQQVAHRAELCREEPLALRRVGVARAPRARPRAPAAPARAPRRSPGSRATPAPPPPPGTARRARGAAPGRGAPAARARARRGRRRSRGSGRCPSGRRRDRSAGCGGARRSGRPGGAARPAGRRATSTWSCAWNSSISWCRATSASRSAA